MFDTLTLNELYALHSQLTNEIRALHDKIMDAEHRPLVPVFGDDWEMTTAKWDEVAEIATAVYAEIDRRDQESAGTRALRDLRNARGIDA